MATATATVIPTMGLLPAPISPIISLQQTLLESFRAGRLSEKSYIIRLRELLNHKIICAEHIVCVFPENIITRFDVAVNDVVKEFAKMLQFVFEMENLRTCSLYHSQLVNF